jgi:hypothetical protein
MEHRQIVQASSFGPDELKGIFAAFDGAWGEIAPKVSANPVVVEAAQMSLATIVLRLANTESITPDSLRAMAMAMFCARHRIEVDPSDNRDTLGVRR